MQMQIKSKKIKYYIELFYNTVLISMITGIFAGVVVTIYNILVHLGEETSLEYYEFFRENPAFIPLLFVALFLGAIIIGTWVRFVPMIRGSGIPQIEGAARGTVHFKWYVTLCSMFATSLACVFLGLSAGGEGPSLEMGGCCGEAVGVTLKRSQMERRLQIAAGSSAGLAVAFNAPITGLFFAMEEAFRSFSPHVFMCATFSVVFSLLTRNGLRTLLGKSVGYTFTQYTFAPMGWDGLLYVVLAAIVVGFMGVAFYYTMLKTKALCKKITLWKGTGRYLIPFLLAGAFGLLTPYAMGGGHEFIEVLGTNGVGSFADIEQIFAIGIVATLVIVVVFKFVAGILAMACGVPCGVFIPMLAMGAGMGGVLSILFQKMGMPAEYTDYLIIICMAVFFVSIVKAPITGFIMVFELTGQIQNFLPAMVGVIIGFVISEVFHTEPIYEKSLHGFMKEEKWAEGLHIIRVQVKVQTFSRAIDSAVRELIWPTNSLVVAIRSLDGSSVVPDGETILHEGDLLTIECESHSEQELLDYLYEIVGKPTQA